MNFYFFYNRLTSLSVVFCFFIPFYSVAEKNTVSFQHSLIFAPHGIASQTPFVLGILKNDHKKPVQNCKITLYFDGNPRAIVTSNDKGIFFYQLRSQSSLDEGKHCVYGVTVEDKIYIRGASFQVSHDTTSSIDILRSGNASTQYSRIVFPTNGMHVNEDQISIICYLADSSNNSVADETMTLKIDDNTVSDTTQSNQNGFASYQLTQQQALDDGQHTVDAYAQESNINLAQQTFTIDTVAPLIPIILSPVLVVGNSATVSGLSESLATVTVFLDGDTFGEITYADEDGNWAILFDNLSTGLHSVTARQADLAMNESETSLPLSFLVL